MSCQALLVISSTPSGVNQLTDPFWKRFSGADQRRRGTTGVCVRATDAGAREKKQGGVEGEDLPLYTIQKRY